jgi:hypothetical protein
MIHHNHSNVSPEEFEDMVRGEDNGKINQQHLFDSLTSINEAFIELNIAKPEDTEEDSKSESEEGSDKEPKSNQG